MSQEPAKSAAPLAWQTLPLAAFDEQAPQWQALNRRYGDSPLLDPLFLAPAIAEFATGTELLAIARRGGSLAAMAILGRSGGFAWQTFQPANAPLGALVLDPSLVAGIDALAPGALARRLPGPALLIGLSQLDPDYLARPRGQARALDLDYIDTARVALSGSYEDYWAARGKNLRHINFFPAC